MVAARAIVAWLFVLVAFVTFSNIVCRSGGPLSESLRPIFVIRTPEDWVDGLRISVVALLVSTAGALIYRYPFTRPSILALAIGFAVMNLDPALLGFDQGYSTLLEQVRSTVTMPPAIPGENPAAAEATFALTAFARDRLYLLYYVGYVLWLIVVLYSGYLGQYIASFALARRHEERRESAVFVAERAGISLFASLLAGVLAVVFASSLAALIAREGKESAPNAWYFDPTVATEIKHVVPAPPKADRAAQESPAKAGVTASPRTRVARAVIMQPEVAAARGSSVKRSDEARLFVYGDQEKQRAYILITALSFFVGAYIVGVVVRPRTSTWVACGAVVAVMLLPAAVIYVFLPSVEIESQVPAGAADDVILVLARSLAGLMARYGTFFRLLELSPFTLASTAVVSALAGDWTAKTLISRRTSRKALPVFKPL
jgi:hypothetical protein